MPKHLMLILAQDPFRSVPFYHSSVYDVLDPQVPGRPHMSAAAVSSLRRAELALVASFLNLLGLASHARAIADMLAHGQSPEAIASTDEFAAIKPVYEHLYRQLNRMTMLGED